MQTEHRLNQWLVAAAFPLLVASLPAHALMAGASPDSPGARVDPNTFSSPFAGVGSLSIGSSTYSGTLIAPGYVLTAAHVASGVAASDIVFNLNVGGNLTQQIGASAVYVNPGYTSFSSTHPADGDLAIIRLAQDAIAGTPSYSLYRGDLAAGTTLTLVGYGDSGNGDTGITSAFANPSVKRVGENNADFFAARVDGSIAKAIYYFDFDGPSAATNIIGGRTLGNSLETSLASGDSGSPAFVRDASGNWLLAGVNTFRFGTTTSFGNGGGGQLIAPYANWIDSVMAPVPEPSPASMLLSALGLLGVVALRGRRD
ncbi:trypsin-like serine protease [Dechloromonas sp. HYN0024]|uniref:trypsin-like serine protease n=1 Tax=Dechloromonas sp. HYN0024 TaxID=2231055 RepID=UPI000E4467DA|nr:trypsin-like serine protease [Dechloromonas sp. HYN0024]AXS80121.1 PEP-CTERM sorting domain-containing protein [Dechloromonas sp. HYN0024]